MCSTFVSSDRPARARARATAAHRQAGLRLVRAPVGEGLLRADRQRVLPRRRAAADAERRTRPTQVQHRHSRLQARLATRESDADRGVHGWEGYKFCILFHPGVVQDAFDGRFGVGILRLPNGLDYSEQMASQDVGDLHLLNLIAGLRAAHKVAPATTKVGKNQEFFIFVFRPPHWPPPTRIFSRIARSVAVGS